ncbi:MAG TPA: heme o synthase [Kineosporiaceae bacterium]
MTAVERRTAVGPGPHRVRRGRMRSARAYLSLTKPRVIELLLVTTVPTMILAQGGMPSWSLVLATLVGGSLAAGSANALNCVYDRDIDVVMRRTENRPLVTGEIAPVRGLVFGIALGVVAVVLLALAVNVLSAGLALAAILFYVLVYTMWLKRRTPQNIVWGGAAGCMPVLIGWSAVTGGLSWAPVVLFGVIFLWTPPHYWPLSMRYRDDYDRAGVPMLGVVAGPVTVARKVVFYAWAMVGCSILLWPVARTGLVYVSVALFAGGAFLLEAYRLLGRARSADPVLAPMRLFHLSITYLTLLFVAVAVDPFLHLPLPHL